MARCRCLVLDHDDTVVRSAETVNYPAFVENMQQTHPERIISLADFNRLCFAYGFAGMCRNVLHLTEDELNAGFEYWKVYVRTHIPPAYEGFDALLHRFRAEGGLICVSSHSSVENIARDYARNFGFQPDAVYAWELGEELRKPNPYALQEIMRRFALRPAELLMVDDMKNGYDMARACGVPFACAGWSHSDPMIIDFMRQNSDFYFETVTAFEAFLFGQKQT